MMFLKYGLAWESLNWEYFQDLLSCLLLYFFFFSTFLLTFSYYLV